MGMGVVSDEEMVKQISNTTRSYENKITLPIPEIENTNQSPSLTNDVVTPVLNGEVIETKSRGRNEGDINVPETLRNLIADTHHKEGRKEALAIAKQFGVSPSSASAYANGATSTKSYNEPKSGLLNVITKRRRLNAHKANKVLGAALNELTPDRIAASKTKDIAIIAKNMASIVNIMEPSDNNDKGPLVQFNLYAPPVRSEDSYESIQAIE